MALLDDSGRPIFDDLLPNPDAVTPIPEAVTPVQPSPNPSAPSATAPPAAEPVLTGTFAEPTAPMPDPLALAPDPAPEPLPPAPPDWDDPTNPWRQEAERARQQAHQAQQTLGQMQTHALAQAEEQSRQRQMALMQRRVQLDARVGDLSPEDFQRQSYGLNQEVARELHAANASKQAIAEHFGRQQEALVWEQSVAQAVTQHGLTEQEIYYVNSNARDTEHLEQLAREFKSRRDERQQFRSVTQQLAELKSAQQQSRSTAAGQRRESGADRTGGVGGSPVPTPAPTSALGLLRQAWSGDPNAPITPR